MSRCVSLLKELSRSASSGTGQAYRWTTLVASEMVAATEGLGQVVLNASNFLRTNVVIMGIVLIGIVAYAFDLLMRYIERLVVPWKGKT